MMGESTSTPSAISLSTAMHSAANAPVMEAVRVPPSAWITSQSMYTVRSPSRVRSQAARRERPISRWISTPRPSFLTPSRALRWGVEPGSMAYSAVSQPFPLPRRKLGTPSCTEAVQITFVRPQQISTEPVAISV